MEGMLHKTTKGMCMKYINKYYLFLISLLMGLFIVPVLPAQELNRSFPDNNPIILGQGQSTSANTQGNTALFSNPAGFVTSSTFGARQKLGIYAGFRLWGNSSLFLDFFGRGTPDLKKGATNMYTDLIKFISNMKSLSRGVIDRPFISELVRKSSDYALGSSMTVGYVNNGFGFGLRAGISTIDQNDKHRSSNRSSVDFLAEYTFVGGYAYTFYLGNFMLNVGADARPFLRYYFQLPHKETTLTIREINTAPFYSGWGIAFDAGMTVRYKGIVLGLQVRDIYTPVFYQESNLKTGVADVIKNYGFAIKLTNGIKVPSNPVIVPTEISVGVMYELPLKRKGFFNMRMHLQLVDPFNLTKHFTKDDLYNFFQVMDMGAEMTLFSFLDLYAGMRDGLLSFGLGLDLFAVELQTSVYDFPVGIPGTERKTPKFAVEIAVNI